MYNAGNHTSINVFRLLKDITCKDLYYLVKSIIKNHPIQRVSLSISAGVCGGMPLIDISYEKYTSININSHYSKKHINAVFKAINK